MIRTVTVYTGESEYARAAQQHAISLAKQLEARLKVVAIWEADAAVPGGDTMEGLAKGNQEHIIEEAKQAGVNAAEAMRGNGLTRGLLEEAHETDLLVLGLPTEADKDRDDLASRLLKTEGPVLRKAECAVLAVNHPPEPIKKILACYDDNAQAKAMLQMAGDLAESYEAEVAILTVESDVARAGELAASAEEYLKGYKLPSVKTLPRPGSRSKAVILEAAEAENPDLIVMGEEGHSWLEAFFAEDVAVQTALTTSIPLLIVR